MKNYSEMTGFEINKSVAELEGLDCNVRQFFNEDGLKLNAVRTTSGYKNYLVNWSEAGPIIFENKIWLREMYGIWDAKGFPDSKHLFNQVSWQDKNPLRAAMIVFLMMKDN